MDNYITGDDRATLERMIKNKTISKEQIAEYAYLLGALKEKTLTAEMLRKINAEMKTAVIKRGWAK